MKVILTVKRYRDGAQYEQKYTVDADPNTTILDLLIKVRDDLDGSLAFRYACRMGICGACMVKINGTPRLACATKISDLGTNAVYVEPLTDKVVKDLIAEL